MLQGAASSAAPAKQGGPADATLLAYGEELPPEDCTEGADESDDGGARRLLRSHAAAAAANGPNGGFKRAAYQVGRSLGSFSRGGTYRFTVQAGS